MRPSLQTCATIFKGFLKGLQGRTRGYRHDHRGDSGSSSKIRDLAAPMASLTLKRPASARPTRIVVPRTVMILRGDTGIRTRDHLHAMEVRYLAALYPRVKPPEGCVGVVGGFG